MSTELSIVIPAYNESAKIERDLEAAIHFLNTLDGESELIVVNDGSKDGLEKVVERYFHSHPSGRVKCHLISYQLNRGKGFAIKKGILFASGEHIAFVDAGLCVPYSFLNHAIQKIRSENLHFAIASRRLKQTKVISGQPLYRRLGSKAFGFFVRSLMGVHFVTDTQCGFKLYKNECAKRIFSKVEVDGFMFDVEALLIAKSLGLKGGEFAVEWSNDNDTRYHPVWGTMRNLRELFRIRLRSLTHSF